MSTYKPPLLESVLLERSHRSVVIREIFLMNMKTPYGGVDEILEGGEEGKKR